MTTRPFHWSVRRELWENRSIYLAPLAVAAIMLAGFLFSFLLWPSHLIAGLGSGAPPRRETAEMPYNVVAFVVLATAIVVGAFYCLDALHGERRDRSVLFWKSLPVSDLTTVAAKASIPLAVLPILMFVVILAAQVVMFLVSTAVLIAHGVGVSALWAQVPMFQRSIALLYALAAVALWHAPIYAWLLLVSAWARRAPLLWAVLPPIALAAIEHLAFRASHFNSFLRYRFLGWYGQAFVPEVQTGARVAPLALLDPVKFLSTPGLWIGLLFAAACLAAAVRLRRYRGPL